MRTSFEIRSYLTYTERKNSWHVVCQFVVAIKCVDFEWHSFCWTSHQLGWRSYAWRFGSSHVCPV